jgi:DNA (cytosine-5)-methyltransferase 1
MSIGLEEAARRTGHVLEIPLAVDSDAHVIGVYRINLPYAVAREADVSVLFDGEIGQGPTPEERKLKKAVGDVDVLLGGPPCQGYSDLNNHTRRSDPKNALYLRMARAAEVLSPKVVVVENVVPVQLDENDVVGTTRETLTLAGYQVASRVVDLRRTGVPQRRRRFLLLASKVAALEPSATLDLLAERLPDHPDRTVRWAIDDLVGRAPDDVYDTPSRSSNENAQRIDYLFERRLFDLPNSQRPECHRDRDHTYVSMYGRLRWDAPAQTITTGFGSMGQGRYVHPSRRRTITPHEAARLQTFPDWFDFGKRPPRGALSKMIGNAVPPLMMVALGTQIMHGLRDAAAAAVRRRA